MSMSFLIQQEYRQSTNTIVYVLDDVQSISGKENVGKSGKLLFNNI